MATSEQPSQESTDSFINVQHEDETEETEEREEKQDIEEIEEIERKETEENESEEEIEKNLELSLKHKTSGNEYYKLKKYDEALNEYTLAIKHCPLNDDKDHEYMSVFYGNRGACYIALEEYESVIEECTESIQHNDKYIKAYWRRAKAYEKVEKWFDAKQDYNQILEIDPNHEISKANLKRIEPMVQQQFEKQKEEVVDKLKTGANWLLGKVGLSLNNFEAQQNPETGAYNINFVQNPNK